MTFPWGDSGGNELKAEERGQGPERPGRARKGPRSPTPQQPPPVPGHHSARPGLLLFTCKTGIKTPLLQGCWQALPASDAALLELTQVSCGQRPGGGGLGGAHLCPPSTALTQLGGWRWGGPTVGRGALGPERRRRSTKQPVCITASLPHRTTRRHCSQKHSHLHLKPLSDAEPRQGSPETAAPGPDRVCADELQDWVSSRWRPAAMPSCSEPTPQQLMQDGASLGCGSPSAGSHRPGRGRQVPAGCAPAARNPQNPRP